MYSLIERDCINITGPLSLHYNQTNIVFMYCLAFSRELLNFHYDNGLPLVYSVKERLNVTGEKSDL